VETVCEGEQRDVRKGLADEADTEGQTIWTHSGWQSNCSEVEKVDKVRIVPEVAVALDGGCRNFIDGVGARSCGSTIRSMVFQTGLVWRRRASSL